MLQHVADLDLIASSRKCDAPVGGAEMPGGGVVWGVEVTTWGVGGAEMPGGEGLHGSRRGGDARGRGLSLLHKPGAQTILQRARKSTLEGQGS